MKEQKRNQTINVVNRTFNLSQISKKLIRDNQFVCKRIIYQSGSSNIANLIRMKEINRAKTIQITCFIKGEV